MEKFFASCPRGLEALLAEDLVAAGVKVSDIAERAGVSLDARGETLTVEQFARMSEALAAQRPGPS